MKKLICLLLVFVMLLTFCACNQDPALESDPAATGETTEATQAATEETLPWWQDMLKDPNAIDFDKIDENVPDKGQYQIHTAAGLQNIAKYPDANFIILRDIDLEGAEWTPVPNFTGKLNGQTFKIKNFTISQPTEAGDLAFIGVNDGTINNMNLENVTITSNENAANIGGLVAVNKGTMRRNNASGNIVVDKAAAAFNVGGVAAVNEGRIETQSGVMNITSTAAGKANIGGLVGVQKGGNLSISTVEGDMNITNAADKLVGMFCGTANDVDMSENAFAGASRLVDGELLEAFCGAEENVTNTSWTLRDYLEPLTGNILLKRQRVVEEVNAMAGKWWTVKKPLTLDVGCGCCQSVTFMPGIQYRGLPYNHKNGSNTRFLTFLDENDQFVDWVYDSETFDGWDIYVGNDCSTGFQQALAVVCNDCELMRSRDQFPGLGFGTAYPVGDWDYSLIKPEAKGPITTTVIEANGVDKMLECYAQMRIGDGLGSIVSGGGHCRMVTADPVVMRDENGKIDPDKSYVLETDQVASFSWRENSSYISSWWMDRKQTFSTLLEVGMLPLTWAELNNDDPIATPEITIENGVEGRFGLTTGVVTSNVYLDSVSVVVKDETGAEVINHRMFCTADKRDEGNLDASGKCEDFVIRTLPKTYDLAFFSNATRNLVVGQGKTYTAQIIAHTSSGFDVVVKDLSF